MKIYCPDCEMVHVTCGAPGYSVDVTKKDPSWLAAVEGVARHHTTRLDQIDSRVNALAESLSRRLDALEKQAGQVGVRPSGYTGTISYGEPTIEEYTKAFDRAQPGSGGSDSDSKDALVRDLMAQVGNSYTYPYVEWNDRILRLRDRAEKLGVKL